jgi:hypothetical protein
VLLLLGGGNVVVAIRKFLVDMPNGDATQTSALISLVIGFVMLMGALALYVGRAATLPRTAGTEPA